jgi:D-alanine transaminase
MATEIPKGIACVNGEFYRLNEAKIPLNDRGFLFGHSVFETLLIKQGKIISWEKHFQRLINSCQKSQIRIPNEIELKKIAEQCVEKNIELTKEISEKTALRIIITGGSSFELGIKRKNNLLPQSNFIFICRNIKSTQFTSVALKSKKDMRSKAIWDVKSCNYLLNIIALDEANQDGYQDVLFFNSKHVYTESSSANFIWFNQDHEICSHPFDRNCLPGTTLQTLIEALKINGLTFKWTGLHRKQIELSKGCAIVSSTRLVLPVHRIDQHTFEIEKYDPFFKTLNRILEENIK